MNLSKNFKGISKLNLGCGSEYRKGWINIDLDPQWKPDILCNIEEGIPLEDNTIDKIFIKHVLEHIDPRKFQFVMEEVARICKPGAIIKIYCPYFSCSLTYKTIDHISAITYYTFDGFDKFRIVSKKMHFFRKSFGYESKIVSKIIKILNPLVSFLPNTFPLLYERFFCWVFPVEEIEVLLKKK